VHVSRECTANEDDAKVIADLSDHKRNSYRIVTAIDSFNFLTCHGAMTKSTSDAEFIAKFGKPFHKTAWLFMGFGIILVTLLSGILLLIFKNLPFKDVCIVVFESILFALVFQYPITNNGMIRRQMHF